MDPLLILKKEHKIETSKARRLNESILTYISSKKNIICTRVILNDTGHGSLAEIFSSNNVVSVTMNLTVTTTPGKRTSSPSFQVRDWRKAGRRSSFLSSLRAGRWGGGSGGGAGAGAGPCPSPTRGLPANS